MKTVSRCTLALVGLCLAGALGHGCGGDPTGPVAGTVEVTFTTPNSDDAAVLLRVTGPAMTGVSADAAGSYLKTLEEGETVTVVVAGDLTSGPLIRFGVPDVRERALESYSATLLQVASRTNALRSPLSGYSLTISRAGG
jgi:hypothetical protein